jgi:hypothetical protein
MKLQAHLLTNMHMVCILLSSQMSVPASQLLLASAGVAANFCLRARGSTLNRHPPTSCSLPMVYPPTIELGQAFTKRGLR